MCETNVWGRNGYRFKRGDEIGCESSIVRIIIKIKMMNNNDENDNDNNISNDGNNKRKQYYFHAKPDIS